ncbi:MAG: hypothetical protein WB709_01680 [Solirubrobacteraceae bacterium]
MALCFSTTAGATTIKRDMLLEGHHLWNEEPREGTWQANSDGTSFRPAAYTWGELPALAPDGRTVAFALNQILGVKDISGGSERTLYNAGFGGTIHSPQYSHDGKKLIFAKEYGSSEDIDTINADGTELKTIVSGLYADRVAPDFSPDDTKIAYTTGEGTSLVVANADGSEPETVSTGLEHVTAPRFSPGGTKIAFGGNSTTTEGEIEGETQIFTINTNGTGLKQITFDEFTDKAEWSPSGARIFYTAYKEGGEEQVYSSKADGTGEESLLEPSGFSYSRNAAFPTGGVSDDEYLGLNYAPILRFDSAEKWRPLNVDAFMREEDPENEGHSYNKLCTKTGCDELGAEWESEVAFGNGLEGPRYIQMGRQDEETYPYPTSPVAECHAEVLIELWDCDTGPRTSMYYHVVPSANAEETTELGYNYVDYWVFYRYNQDQNDPSAVDDHEGDWEGLTVAPSVLEPGAVDFAIFAQHGNHYTYTPEVLECDAGGVASCGSGEPRTGQRVWDYVAVSTHASYPEPDTGGETKICTQTKSEAPEGCHDGEVPWGANHDAANVLPLPASGEDKWTDWPGRWGNSTGITIPFEAGYSPPSPGLQARYQCPWQWYESEPTACPSKAKASQASARELEASTCGNWFGGSIVATLCSPGVLRSAIHKARMGRPGTLHIRLGRRAGRSGSRPGVAQATGAPLREGESLVVDGQAPADTTLLARAQASGHLIEAAFNRLGLTHGGRGVVKGLRTHAGIRLVWIAPDGQPVAPTKIRTSLMARQAQSPQIARHVAHSAPSHSGARSAAAPSHAVQQAAAVRLRACQQTATSDRRKLKALAHRQRRGAVRVKVHALHEKLAYRKC